MQHAHKLILDIKTKRIWLFETEGSKQLDKISAHSGSFEDVRRILPYCNEAEFYDNGNGFVKVGEYRNGELLRVGEYVPRWLRQLQDCLRSS